MLCYAGAHLINRNKAIVLLPQTQMTVIGILLGILMIHEEENLGVMIVAFLITFLSGLVLQFMTRKIKSHFAEWMLGVYFILLAVGHLMTRGFPQLESHFHQSFEGDIVTATQNSLLFSGFFLLLASVYFIINRKKNLSMSFEIGIGQKKDKEYLFAMVISLFLTIGVFLLGGAFTMGYLILPSLLISKVSKSYKEHIFLTILISLLSSVSGFLLSLKYSYLATTPTMIVMLLIYFLPLYLGSRLNK